MRIKISNLMGVFAIAVCAGVVSLALIGRYALMKLEVSGPVYTQISTNKDLLADILPPPAYVIEAYLEANLAVQDPTTVAARKARLAKLHAEYSDRLNF